MSGSDSQPSAYAQAGVDVGKEESALAGLLGWVRKTFAQRPAGTPGHVAVDVGYFASILELTPELSLAVAADGVGTKLLIAQLTGNYETVGIDLVAMNVNDLICVGAEPISLLDYVAVEELRPDMLTAIGKGLHDAAAMAGITISGGELAQIGAMLRGAVPGRAFDLAAVALGTVHPEGMLLGDKVRPGDVVVGLASSGIHSNGLSLARRVLLEQAGLSVVSPFPDVEGKTVGEVLLEPTRIYVKPVLELLRDESVELSALAHITGGGFKNMTRIQARCAYNLSSLPPPPPVFQALARLGAVPLEDMYAAFNMGVGFTLTLRPGGEDRVIAVAQAHGIDAWVIGEAVPSETRRVSLPSVGLQADSEGFRPL